MRDARPTAGEARRQFEQEVFPTELDYLADRRRSAGDDRPPPRPGELSTDNELVGVALSGGGIRSASFSLGFLQALGDRFRRIDYLSTVSGGGFIGSSISALMAGDFYRRVPASQAAGSAGDRQASPPAEFPFPLTGGEREAPSISHLRNNSNYMAPGGPGDLFRLLAVLVRGIILNSLSLLPFLFMVCLVVLLMYGQQLSDRARFDNQVEQIDALLGRYFGSRFANADEVEPELEPLLATLEGEALLRIDQGKTRGRLIHQLRPPLTLQGEAPEALIIGNGSEEAPYRLVRDATRKDFARALLEGGVLQRYAIIEEVDLLARVLEQNGYRHSRASPGGLVDHLGNRGLIRPGTDESDLAALLGRHWTRGPPPADGEPPARRLKPLLQLLYNGEYLNDETVRRLVREELGRHSGVERPAFYAYGWYEARIGQAFAESWYADNPWPRERVASELRRLTAAFGPECLPERGGRSPCLRPRTTRDDVGRLLRTKGIVDAPDQMRQAGKLSRAVEALYFGEYLDQEWVRRSLGAGEPEGEEPTLPAAALALAERLVEEGFRRCPLPGLAACCADVGSPRPADRAWRASEPHTRPAPGPGPIAQDPIPEVVAAASEDGADPLVGDRQEPAAEADFATIDELLEAEEMLYAEPAAELEAWLADPSSISPGCDHSLLPRSLDELFGRLVLARGTVPADVLEVLEQQGLRETAEGWGPLASPDRRELARVLDAAWELLDPEWVNRLLHVYAYGWHRSLVGRPYPGAWCGSTRASVDDRGCAEASDESWAELARALRDPSRWDPNRLWLPFTWMVIRFALGWVLLFPLLLIAARWAYGRRLRRVAGASNPLRALLSSDQSLNWRDLYERTFGVLLVVILGVALVELLPYAVHHFHYLGLRGQSSRTLVVGALSLLVTALAGPALALLQRFGRLIALGLLAVAGPLLLLTVFVYTMEHAVYAPPPQVDALLGFVHGLPGLSSLPEALWRMEGGRRMLQGDAALLLFAVTTAAAIGLALLIDINATSLHGLYRDRIAKAFMVGLDTEGDIEPEEDLPLRQICPPGSGAPYHLINVALNLQGSDDRSLRGRDSDFLFFSRDHIGGPRTGFCPTEGMARVFPHAHLAGAMAVSGAAVSPNMGRYKSGPLAVLMSLLNTRLALWMPHPAAVRKWLCGPAGRPAVSSGGRLRRLWRRFRLRAPATLLLRELAGAVHDRGPVVNLSDGGHIENTGAVELLRRRCREITIVDGEADPGMTFGGLAQLQRIARIEMGIEIEIDLDELRPDENGFSRRRSAVGVVRYPARAGAGGEPELAEETGRLLYVKLAVTGREGETVAEYRARKRDFPHQSTANQAFDESQFEAYRELGYLAGREIFEAEQESG